MITKMISKTFFLIILLFSITSCESVVDVPDPQQYEERIVLNGNLEVGSKTVRVQLNLTASIDELFDEKSTLLSNATVIMKHNLEEYLLSEIALGIYSFTGDSILIKSFETYTIEVSDGLHLPVSATTTAPAAIEMYEILPGIETLDSITYIPAGDDAQFLDPFLFSYKIIPKGSGAFPPMVRLVNQALDARKETMIMEDDTLKAFLFKWNGIGYEDDEDIQERILTRSATAFNSVDPEALYKMAWIYYTFYGPQRLELFSLDQAYYNFHINNLEGTPQDPNYLPESNVIGGFGLLSSSYMLSMEYYLSRPN